MPIPRFFEFFPSVMECLLPGEVVTAQEMREFCTHRLHISPEDQEILLPSGTQKMYSNRLNWAVAYLKKAELVASPKRGQYQITQKGIEAYKQTKGRIDLRFLNTIESFVEFQTAS